MAATDTGLLMSNIALQRLLLQRLHMAIIRMEPQGNSASHVLPLRCLLCAKNRHQTVGRGLLTDPSRCARNQPLWLRRSPMPEHTELRSAPKQPKRSIERKY